eukprot:6447907-Prymnesium_polylepis.1
MAQRSDAGTASTWRRGCSCRNCRRRKARSVSPRAVRLYGGGELYGNGVLRAQLSRVGLVETDVEGGVTLECRFNLGRDAFKYLDCSRLARGARDASHCVPCRRERGAEAKRDGA